MYRAWRRPRAGGDEGEGVHGYGRELLAVRPVRVLALSQARHVEALGGCTSRLKMVEKSDGIVCCLREVI